VSIDYKGGKVEWDLFKNIDLSKPVSWKTEGYLSQDLLTLSYENCIIDLGWYGGEEGHFSIFVVVPENNGEYSPESWAYPWARIPCENQYDMLFQLQRAIDIYPAQIKSFGKKLQDDNFHS
jgi:hypothetical protein